MNFINTERFRFPCNKNTESKQNTPPEATAQTVQGLGMVMPMFRYSCKQLDLKACFKTQSDKLFKVVTLSDFNVRLLNFRFSLFIFHFHLFICPCSKIFKHLLYGQPEFVGVTFPIFEIDDFPNVEICKNSIFKKMSWYFHGLFVVSWCLPR